MDFDGTSGNDQYFGTPEADEIHGHRGQDQLRGAGGDDTINGGDGPDSLYGDQGNDTIYGGAGDDVVRGGRGEDDLRGGDGIDMLAGDRDDDVLLGGDGDDILLGGPGDDMIRGGAGADFINGGEGELDLASYLDSPVGVEVEFHIGLDLAFGSGGHADGDILVGIEILVGSEHDDVLDSTNDRAEALFGDDGDDTLWGGGGDSLFGDSGDDHLLALWEGGVMEGGPGNDIFEFYGGQFTGGEIEDFTKGEDKIAFDFFVGDVSAASLDSMLQGSRGNVLDLSLLGPGFEEFGELTLNVSVSTLDASDFIIQ